MSTSFDIDPVLRIAAGAVGQPGDRTFFLQARSADQLVTLLVEKEQVRALAVSLQQMLASLPGAEDLESPPEDEAPELEEPLLPEWRVGPMALQFDESRDRLVLVANELVEEESVEGAAARVVITREQARLLAEQAERVVEAGRPTCRFCGSPMNPDGHICTAMNGHRSMDS